MPAIFNANRSGALPDQRSAPRRQPTVTDIRSGSMPNAVPDAGAVPKPPTAHVRYKIVLEDGELVLVEADTGSFPVRR